MPLAIWKALATALNAVGRDVTEEELKKKYRGSQVVQQAAAKAAESVTPVETVNPMAAKAITSRAQMIDNISELNKAPLTPDVRLALLTSGMPPQAVDALLKTGPVLTAAQAPPEDPLKDQVKIDAGATYSPVMGKDVAAKGAITAERVGDVGGPSALEPFVGDVSKAPTSVAEYLEQKEMLDHVGGMTKPQAQATGRVLGEVSRAPEVPADTEAYLKDLSPIMSEVAAQKEGVEALKDNKPKPGESLEDFITRRTKAISAVDTAPEPIDYQRVEQYARFRQEVGPAASPMDFVPWANTDDIRQGASAYDGLEAQRQQYLALRADVIADPKLYTPDALTQIDEAIATFEFYQHDYLRSLQTVGDLPTKGAPYAPGQVDYGKVFADATAKFSKIPGLATFNYRLTMDDMVERYHVQRLLDDFNDADPNGRYYGMAPLRQEDYFGGPERKGFEHIAPPGWDRIIWIDENDPLRQEGIYGFAEPKTQALTVKAHDYWKDKPQFTPANVAEVAEKLKGAKPWEIGILQRELAKKGVPIIVTEKADDMTIIGVASYNATRAQLDMMGDGVADALKVKAEGYLKDYGTQLINFIDYNPNLFAPVRSEDPRLPENQPGLPPEEKERRYQLRLTFLDSLTAGAQEDLSKDSGTAIRTFATQLMRGEFNEAFPLLTSLKVSEGAAGKKELFELYSHVAPSTQSTAETLLGFRDRFGKGAIPSEYRDYLITDDKVLLETVGGVFAPILEGAKEVGSAMVDLKNFIDQRAAADDAAMGPDIQKTPFSATWEAMKVTADNLYDYAVKPAGGVAGAGLKAAFVDLPEYAGRSLMFWTVVGKTVASGNFDELENFNRWIKMSQQVGGEYDLLQEMGIDSEEHPMLAFLLDFGMEVGGTAGFGALAKLGVYGGRAARLGIKGADEAGLAAKINKLPGLDTAFVAGAKKLGLADSTHSLIAGTEDVADIMRFSNNMAGIDPKLTVALQQAKTEQQVSEVIDDFADELGVNLTSSYFRQSFEFSPATAWNQVVNKVLADGNLGKVADWLKPFFLTVPETARGIDLTDNIFGLIERYGSVFRLSREEIADWMHKAHEMRVEVMVGEVLGDVYKKAVLNADRRFMDDFTYSLQAKISDKLGLAKDDLLELFPKSKFDEINDLNRSAVRKVMDKLSPRIARKVGWKDIKQSEYGEDIIKSAIGQTTTPKVQRVEQAAKEFESADVLTALVDYVVKEGVFDVKKGGKAITRTNIVKAHNELFSNKAVRGADSQAAAEAALREMFGEDAVALFRLPSPKTEEDFIEVMTQQNRLDDYLNEIVSRTLDDIMERGVRSPDEYQRLLNQTLEGNARYRMLRTLHEVRRRETMQLPQYRNADDVRTLFTDMMPGPALESIVGLVKKMRKAGTQLIDERMLNLPASPMQLSNIYRPAIPLTYLASLQHLTTTMPALNREAMQRFLKLDVAHRLWKEAILFGWGTQAKIAFDDLSRLLALGINPLAGSKHFAGRYKWIEVPKDVSESHLNAMVVSAAAPMDWRLYGAASGNQPLSKPAYQQWLGMESKNPFVKNWIKLDQQAAAKGLTGEARAGYVQERFVFYARSNYNKANVEGYRAIPRADDPQTTLGYYNAKAMTPAEAVKDALAMDAFYRHKAKLGDKTVQKIFTRAAEKDNAKISKAEWQYIDETVQPTVWAAEDAAARGSGNDIISTGRKVVRGAVKTVYSPLTKTATMSRGAVYRRYYEEAYQELTNVASKTDNTLRNAHHLADRYARAKVDEITYSTSRTSFEHASRNVVPFGPAYRDFAEFWAKHFARRPTHAIAAYRMQEMPDNLEFEGRGLVDWVPFIGDQLGDLADIALSHGVADGASTIFRFNPKNAFFFTGGSSNFLPAVGPLLTVPLSKLVEMDPDSYSWISKVPGFNFVNPDSALFGKLDRLVYAATGKLGMDARGLGRPLGVPLGYEETYYEKQETSEYAQLYSQWVGEVGMSQQWLKVHKFPYPDDDTVEVLKEQARKNVASQQGMLFAGQFFSPAGMQMETPAVQLEKVRNLLFRAESNADRNAIVRFYQTGEGELPDYLLFEGQKPPAVSGNLAAYVPAIAKYMGASDTGRKKLLESQPELTAIVAPRTEMVTSGKPNERTRLDLDRFAEKIREIAEKQKDYSDAKRYEAVSKVRAAKWDAIMRSQGGELSPVQAEAAGKETLLLKGQFRSTSPTKFTDNEAAAFANYKFLKLVGVDVESRYAGNYGAVAAKFEANRLEQIATVKGKPTNELTDSQLAVLGLPNDEATMKAVEEYFVMEKRLKADMAEQGITGQSKEGKALLAQLDAKAEVLSERSSGFAEVLMYSKIPEWARVRESGVVADSPNGEQWTQAFAVLDQMTKDMAAVKASKEKHRIYAEAMAEIEAIKKQKDAFAKEFSGIFSGKNDLKPSTAQQRAYMGDSRSGAGGGKGGKGRRKGVRKGRRGKRGGKGGGVKTVSHSSNGKKRMKARSF